MNCLTLRTNDPFINLATEEYLLKNSDGEFLILYSNIPSVVIGKHQSPHRESDTEYVIKHKIPVIRRLSGGGTVYHDEGNLNFTFIRNSEPGHQVDFRKYTRPVIEFLSAYGVDARLEGKNDLKVNGLKISGNAEHVHRNRVMHHGTLLFDSDLAALKKSLRKDTSAYITRAVNSNPSSVANLKQFMPGFSSTDQFRRKMEEYFLNLPGNQTYSLKEEEIKVIERLADTKYRTWEWNYAYGPDYQLIKHIDYKSVRSHLRIEVKQGVITECIFEDSELKKTFSKFNSRKHMVNELEEVIEKEDITGLSVYSFF
jgi:lipoate-protein ligase A